MNKAGYDQQKLRAFLLGALSEAETEIFDELSFTDDSFADQLNAAEKDLVDAYLRGELGGANLANFEKYYLATPNRCEKVDFARAFQAFAETKVAQKEAPTSGAGKEKKSRFANFFASLSSVVKLRHAPSFGLAAATLLMIVLGGWLWTENRRLSEQASQTQKKRDELLRREQELQKQLQSPQTEKPGVDEELSRLREERQQLENELNREKSQKEQLLVERRKQADQERRRQQQPKPIEAAPRMPAKPRVSIASFILAPPVRGSQISTLSIPSRTDFVATQLQLETSDFAAYRVALVDQSNRTIWLSGRLKEKRSVDGGALTVRFPARILKSQIYSLVVSGVGANGAAEEISSYPIRVVLN